MRRLLNNLTFRVLVAIALGVLLGVLSPDTAKAMRPLGDTFVNLVKMVIAPIVFFTIVLGIATLGDLKRVGRVGGKALLYFEIVTTFALAIGLVVVNVIKPGAGLDVSRIAGGDISRYTTQAQQMTFVDFVTHIVPANMLEAFVRGEMLQVVFVAVLFGVALSALGEMAKPALTVFEVLSKALFKIVGIIMIVAPIGAFGAMAFTVGRYGLSSLGPLAKLIVTLWITAALFVLIVLGGVAAIAGFNIIRFLKYIREEIVLTLSLSSSDPALPSLMRKLENLGCSKALVGLVTPTGYIFNPDGSCIYMTLAAVFVAQATGVTLTLGNYVTLFAVAALTHKGAVGIQGAAFIALVATLMVIPSIPVAGMALILGLDRFMSMCRATVNMLCNGVATLVVSRWEGELDGQTLRKNLEALT